MNIDNSINTYQSSTTYISKQTNNDLVEPTNENNLVDKKLSNDENDKINNDTSVFDFSSNKKDIIKMNIETSKISNNIDKEQVKDNSFFQNLNNVKTLQFQQNKQNNLELYKELALH